MTKFMTLYSLDIPAITQTPGGEQRGNRKIRELQPLADDSGTIGGSAQLNLPP
jgi:hypothetical protein